MLASFTRLHIGTWSMPRSMALATSPAHAAAGFAARPLSRANSTVSATSAGAGSMFGAGSGSLSMGHGGGGGMGLGGGGSGAGPSTMGPPTYPICLICLEVLTPEEFESGEAISLQCLCKGEVSLRHRRCAIEWSHVSGGAGPGGVARRGAARGTPGMSCSGAGAWCYSVVRGSDQVPGAVCMCGAWPRHPGGLQNSQSRTTCPHHLPQHKGDVVCDICKQPIANLPPIPDEVLAAREAARRRRQPAFNTAAEPNLADHIFDCIRATWVAMIICVLFFDMTVGQVWVHGIACRVWWARQAAFWRLHGEGGRGRMGGRVAEAGRLVCVCGWAGRFGRGE